jgi:hypothetical protein
VDCGPWTVDRGLGTVDWGPRTRDSGLRTQMDDRERTGRPELKQTRKLPPCVDRDSATRWARHWDVQFEVDELSFLAEGLVIEKLRQR